MVRIFIVAIIVGANLLGGGLSSMVEYKGTPVKVNGEEVSNRVLYRYTCAYVFSENFNQISVTTNAFGNRVLYFYKTSMGYDYYADKNSYLTTRVDTKGTVYIQRVDAKGYKGDWLRLESKLSEKAIKRAWYKGMEQKYKREIVSKAETTKILQKLRKFDREFKHTPHINLNTNYGVFNMKNAIGNRTVATLRLWKEDRGKYLVLKYLDGTVAVYSYSMLYGIYEKGTSNIRISHSGSTSSISINRQSYSIRRL